MRSSTVKHDSHCYRPQPSWAKVIFSQACVKNSVHRGGGCLPQCMLGYTPSPWEQTPPLGADTPPLGADTPGADTPPGTHPPQEQTPPQSRHPSTRHPPPPRKQTAAYGQRAAGTHPTGMHSCLQ